MLIEHNLPIPNFDPRDEIAITKIDEVFSRSLPFLGLYVNVNRLTHTFFDIEVGAFDSINVITILEFIYGILNEDNQVVSDGVFMLSNKHLLILTMQIENKEISDLNKKTIQKMRDMEIPLISDNLIKSNAIRIFTLDDHEQSEELIANIRFRQYWARQDSQQYKKHFEYVKSLTQHKLLIAENIPSVQKVISEIDEEDYISHQDVFTIMDNVQPKSIYRKYHFNFQSLLEKLYLDIDIKSDKWLKYHILSQLDHKLTHYLRTFYDTIQQDGVIIGFPMNISNIQSHGFKNFSDWIVHEELRDKFIIILDFIDIMHNIEIFNGFVSQLKRRNILIGVDGVDINNLNFFDREVINVNFVSIDIDHVKDIAQNNKIMVRLRKFLNKNKREYCILRNCTTHEDIEFGINAGFRMFKGFSADHYVKSWHEYRNEDNDEF